MLVVQDLKLTNMWRSGSLIITLSRKLVWLIIDHGWTFLVTMVSYFKMCDTLWVQRNNVCQLLSKVTYGTKICMLLHEVLCVLFYMYICSIKSS